MHISGRRRLDVMSGKMMQVKGSWVGSREERNAGSMSGRRRSVNAIVWKTGRLLAAWCLVADLASEHEWYDT